MSREIDELVAREIGLVSDANDEPLLGERINQAKPGDVIIEPCKDYLPYSTDIAAAREMENWLEQDRSLRAAYVHLLTKAANPDAKIDGRRVWLPSEGESMLDLLWWLIHATPEQRCLAFLKAMGVEVEDAIS